MTYRLAPVVLLLAALVIALVGIIGAGQVDPIQTDQISRVSECWLGGCR